MMDPIQYNSYIEKNYYKTIGYIKANYCDNDKSKFKELLEKEAGCKIKLLTEIKEKYYRCVKSDDLDYGEYVYKPCLKGKGASLYYYAAFIEEV